MLLPLLLIPGLVMCAKHRRQDQLSQEVTTRLERMIQETRECRSIPGLTLTLVSTQRGTLLSKGYGYTDIEAEEMVNDHTLFCVASLSKAFTSTLLGLLLYNSRYGILMQPIKQIVPLVKRANTVSYIDTRDQFFTVEITLFELLLKHP